MNNIIKELKAQNLTNYEPIPFWSWNAELEPEELKRQIRWMKDSGIGGFFMHARSGLKTEYLSHQWMECILACSEEAERLGMNAWVYDENGWPSGFAGGKLLEDPENCDKYLLHTIGEYDELADLHYILEPQKLVPVAECSDSSKEYLNVYIHTANSTADILNPEVVQKFISLTHEQYKKTFGNEFSKKIKGFFTDEPQYQRWHTPYTKMLAPYFEEHYHENIFEKLGLLFVEKEGYQGFRYRYYKALQTLMLEAFSKMTYEWCDTNNTQLTGHYIEETGLAGQMLCCAGIMPFYEYEHIPGIDWLGKSSDNELPSRQVLSVAKQLGRKQILTETFAGCGWDITPTDLRRIAGFQFVNGVNLLCHHLIPYAEYGNRKHDYPSHFSPVNPWVRESFLEFNNYFTRLGYLLANSKEYINVAVLHPIRSAYFEYKRIGFEERFIALETDLQNTVRNLSGSGIGYHFLDETLLEKYGFVENGKIGCGKCTYEYLVLPSLYTMDSSTEKLIREFVVQGGKLLVAGRKPDYLESEKYNYDYLESNCSLHDIKQAQPFSVTNCNTKIYTTYRETEDSIFIFAQNSSDTEVQEQSFSFTNGAQSFLKLNPDTLETERLPLTITLNPGDGALLFLDKEVCQPKAELQTYELQFKQAKVDFTENYLTIDYVSYSTDGFTFSEPIPCAAIFQQLLAKQYEGPVFFQYTFQVQTVPAKIFLQAETYNATNVRLNGILLHDKKSLDFEGNTFSYDVTDYVKLGENIFAVEMNWHEDAQVYHALFGENVTESLKNCIVYDSEVEPVYLTGRFGVYSETEYEQDENPWFVHGKQFYIGKIPETVSEPTTDGFPFLSGTIKLSQKFSFDTNQILLKVLGSYMSAIVSVNGQIAGKLLFERELDISKYAQAGENEIAIQFCVGNFNLLGPHHHVQNKAGVIGPMHFELTGQWDNNTSPLYHDYYDLKCLYKR